MGEPHDADPRLVSEPHDVSHLDRRGMLARASTWFMAGGLVASYGACAAMGGRYLFPPRPRELAWVFVARVASIAPGSALSFRAPSGESISIARNETGGDAAEDFVALSSVCPHLSCQVHWEPQNTRFFCPCHNGVFTPTGDPVSGPPAEAGQALPRYPLEVERGLLYVQVPVRSLPRPNEDA